MGEAIDARIALEMARRLLGGIAKQHHDQRGTVSEVMALLDAVEAELQQQARPVQRRTGENTRYAIETVNRRPMLAEYRSVGRPLRIDHRLFDAVTAVLAGTARPLAFDELTNEVERAMSARPVDWQMRVVLRFLLRAEPAILVRERSKYAPESSRGFSAAAQRMWRTTAQQSAE